nr:uncharacterized protein LOC105844645 [Hydra vulgaris]
MDEESFGNDFRLKDNELFKIKLALSSLTNTVIICPTVATLYTQALNDDETWSYLRKGVPGVILIHNKNKEVTSTELCLADPASGFAVWREILNENSEYRAVQKNFHSFKLYSTGQCSMGGLKFPITEVANNFLQDVLNSIPKFTVHELHEKHIEKRTFSLRRLHKEEISLPCMFLHVSGIKNKQNEKKKSITKSQHLS